MRAVSGRRRVTASGTGRLSPTFDTTSAGNDDLRLPAASKTRKSGPPQTFAAVTMPVAVAAGTSRLGLARVMDDRHRARQARRAAALPRADLVRGGDRRLRDCGRRQRPPVAVLRPESLSVTHPRL